MTNQIPDDQPGNPEQLSIAVETAERQYERTLQTFVVFWDYAAGRYRVSIVGLYRATGTIEVVRIPR